MEEQSVFVLPTHLPLIASSYNSLVKTLSKLVVLMSVALTASSQAADKTLIDYFLPMPIQDSLVSNLWGAPGVFPRDPPNGLEDVTMKQ